MIVTAVLADGSVVEGELGGWAEDWAEIDGRRWDGVVFIDARQEAGDE